MHPDRIAELLKPFLGPGRNQQLTAETVASISTYVDILLRWNARMNLTSIRTEEQIVTRHFGESFFAARQLFPESVHAGTAGVHDPGARGSSVRLADLGSGAGFPGLPIKLWAPDIELTLIESNHKKATFLREVTRALQLTGVDVQNTRAEALGAAMFDVVTLRAVERFPETLVHGARLVVPEGRLALLIGASQVDQARSMGELIWDAPIPIPESASRILLVGRANHSGKDVGRK